MRDGQWPEFVAMVTTLCCDQKQTMDTRDLIHAKTRANILTIQTAEMFAGVC